MKMNELSLQQDQEQFYSKEIEALKQEVKMWKNRFYEEQAKNNQRESMEHSQISNHQTVDTEQMLSQQLKEMTEVLDEFDIKYSKKEKQLEYARDQYKQLKDAFDAYRGLNEQLKIDLQDS